MPILEARYQSLAACGAAIVTFIGVCHEFVGSTLFPWGPALFGGAIGWHSIGIACIALGLLVLGGTLGLIAFPVVPFALAAVLIGITLVIFTAVAHGQFHLFALTAAVSGGITAFFHRKAVAQQGAPADGPRAARSDRG